MTETYAGEFTILAVHASDLTGAPDAIARAGGMVVPLSHDPLVALFRGDAVDAAVGAFRSLGSEEKQTRGAITVGVLEITGSADRPPVIVGDAYDLALRLAAAARPGQLLADEAARGQVSDYGVDPLPSLPIKGKSAPVQIYEVALSRSALHSVYGSMISAMGGGTAASEPAPAGPTSPAALGARWEASVAEGRWAGSPRGAEAAAGSVAVASDAVEDRVDCTVFAPSEAAAGASFLVQVFAHLVESADVVAALAREMDEDAERRGFKSLEVPVARGEKLHFELAMPGLEVDDPVQSLVWSGRPESVQFGVSVPRDRPAGAVIGTVIVSRRSVPIGHVKFKLTVTAETPRAGAGAPTAAAGAGVRGVSAAFEPEPTGDAARRYTRAFVSYASADRKKVLERVQMLGALGIRYFQDVLDLEPGERWEGMLYERIAECDLFLLFWSSAAKESEWVRKEVEAALARKAGDELAPPEIRPVILEGPPIVPPPLELAHLHFNDRLVYFMAES